MIPETHKHNLKYAQRSYFFFHQSLDKPQKLISCVMLGMATERKPISIRTLLVHPVWWASNFISHKSGPLFAGNFVTEIAHSPSLTHVARRNGYFYKVVITILWCLPLERSTHYSHIP